MKTHTKHAFYTDTLTAQEYKKKINEISSEPSALTRFRKTEAARTALIRGICHTNKPGSAGYGMEIFGIATGLLGCLSIIAITQVTNSFGIPISPALAVTAPSLVMILTGTVITNIGVYKREISGMEDKEQKTHTGDLLQLIEEMEKVEGEIIRDYGTEIVAELGKSAPSAINKDFPRLKEVLLRQLQH